MNEKKDAVMPRRLEQIVSTCRLFPLDHGPDGYPPIQMQDITALCDEVERLQKEVTKKKHWFRREDEPWEYWMHSAANYECEFKIFIRGPLNRKGIERMIQHLELTKDLYEPEGC